MDKIEKIRQEIEQNIQAIKVLNEHTTPEQTSKTCAIFQYSVIILSELLSFIDSLSEEPDKSLEEAAETFNRKDAARMWDYEDKTEGEIVEAAFKAGAEWQELKMMEGAVEGEIIKDIHNLLHVKSDVLPMPSEYKFGDKVKIIILKGDKQNGKVY